MLKQGKPVWIHNLLLSLRGFVRRFLRENNQSISLCESLLDNETSIDKLSQFSQSRLKTVLSNCVENVPAYSQYGRVAPCIEDFGFIDKASLKGAADSFRSCNKPFPVIKGSTSGTTGSPLSVPQSMESVIREHAFVMRHMAWAGFEKGDKRAWIRGDVIVPINQQTPPYWRYSYLEDMILLSSFHMTQSALPLYIQAMVDYGVDIIQAYPSSVTALAKYLQSKGEYYPGSIKSVITSSESLSEEDRNVIEERFQCKVFDWYGLFERVAAIANCEHGRYHVLTDYAHVEFIDVGNGLHEIVGTSFNNQYYPLIRYKTGDQVVLSEEKECPCGRVYPLVERIEGRSVEHVFAFDGQKVFALDQCVKGVEGIQGSQYVQDSLNEIVVNVVVDNSFTEEQSEKLVANVRSRLGEKMRVRIEKVEQLLRTKNGKVRQAICSIKDES